MKYINKAIAILSFLVLFLGCAPLIHQSSYIAPEYTIFSKILVKCDNSTPEVCEDVKVAFSKNNIALDKDASTVAKVSDNYGAESQSTLVGVEGNAYGASSTTSGLKYIGISVYRNDVLIARASINAAPGAILFSNPASLLVVKNILEKEQKE